MKGRAWAYIFLAQINCGLSPQNPLKACKSHVLAGLGFHYLGLN